jgi:arsenical-resistance protein 2
LQNSEDKVNMAESQPEKQWWEAFPAPRAACPEITADDLMKKFDELDIEPKPRDFLLVDVRRTDWEVSEYNAYIS